MKNKKISIQKLPFFSVVVPVYNKGAHVFRALESILNQTFKDFELIIVCDPSTDNSYSEVAKFNDSRIRIFNRDQPGPGGYAARNLGVIEAKAEWIAFLDADDIWLSSHLSYSFNAIKTNPQIGYGFFNSVKKIGDKEIKRFDNIVDGVYSSIDLLKIYINIDIIHTNSIFARKSNLIEAGLFPDGIAKRGGDSDLWMRLMLCSSKCFVSSIVTNEYYYDNSGVTKNYGTAGNIHPITLSVKSIINNPNYGNECKKILMKISNRKTLSLYLVTKRFGSFEYYNLTNIFYSRLDLNEWLKVLFLLVPYIIAKKIRPLK